MNIFQMSFYGGVLIGVILLIRAVSKNLLPKKTFLILWIIALARLLIPFSIQSSISIYSFLHLFSYTKKSTTIHLSQQTTNSIPWWTFVWIIGAIILASLFIFLYLHHRWSFKTSLPVDNSYITKWLENHKIIRNIQVKQSDRINSPLTYGILNPIILIPKNTDLNNEQQLNFVLLHEYIHIRNFDAVVKLISVICLCLHWFNPLVWIMYFILNRDIELVCDECVVKSFGEKAKASYALTLISMEEAKSVVRPFCSNYSKIAIEERIVAIMKTKKLSRISAIIAAAIIVTTAAVFTTSAVANKDKGEVSSSQPVESDNIIAKENKTEAVDTEVADAEYYKLVEDENDSDDTENNQEISVVTDDSTMELLTGEDYYLEEVYDGSYQIIDKKTDDAVCEIMVEEDNECVDSE